MCELSHFTGFHHFCDRKNGTNTGKQMAERTGFHFSGFQNADNISGSLAIITEFEKSADLQKNI